MFNVTILKMKDIMKFFLEMTITILAVIAINNTIKTNVKQEQKIVQEVKNGLQLLSKNSLLNCFEETIPVAASINEEYNNIAKEDDYMESEDILHAMLKTQISSIKGLEIAEEKNKSVENIEMVTRRKGTRRRS